MINLPRTRFLNMLLPRRIKVILFRIYNYMGIIYNNMPYCLIGHIKPNGLNYPKYLSLSLTTRCNLHCTICDRKDFKPSDMDFKNIYKLENPIKYAKKIDLTSWGEAILYPKYEEIIKYIFSINNKKKLISQTTNGTSDKYGDLLRGRLDRLVISLNAATPETYNREMKGGDFNKTISTVKSLLSKLTYEDRKVVRLHFVTHKNNYKEMPIFVELAKSLNVMQVSFGPYLANGPDTEQNTLIYIQNEYHDVLEKVEKASKKFDVEVFYLKFSENYGLSPKNCMSPYESCFISPEGDLSPCCFIGDNTFGNVFKNSFESVWLGEKLQNLRKTRNLSECSVCAPFHSFDNLESHLTSRYNQKRIVSTGAEFPNEAGLRHP